jgi:hypothetical protein
MKTIFAATAAAAALAALAVPAQAQNWSTAAKQDLKAIHDTLAANSPAPHVERDSAGFRSWLDAGYAQVTALDLNKINNPAAYDYALRAYVGGFRDANIQVLPNWAPPAPWYAVTWPGFSTAWRNNGYVVAYSAGGSKLPPVGAQLTACDKKPIADIAKQRLDRFEGNLNLESDRFKTAPYLLWERANPWIGLVPLKCDFLVNGKKKSYTITPQIGGEAERKAAFMAAAAKPQGIGLEQVNGGYWISLHTLEEGQPWDGLFAQIDGARDAIRNAPVVVIDLRGADAGTAARGYSVINRLWDPVFIQSKQPTSVDMAYRVSPNNRAFYADALARMNANDLYFYQRPRWQQHLNEFDAALAAQQPLLRRNEGAKLTDAVPENPMKSGKIIVLTDYWCTAGCLDMVDILRSLPNVTHAGAPTGADTIFVGHVEAQLPSGQSRIGYGDKAWLDRQRLSYQPFTPSKLYTGDLNNEQAVRAWVAGL